MLCRIVCIYSTQHTTQLWQQCLCIHHQNMHDHIGNLFCGIVQNVHIFILQVQNQISPIPMSYNTFHVYRLISHYTVHGRRPFNKNKQFQLCEASFDSEITTKLYTIKQLVLVVTLIVDFLQLIYIPTIHKLPLRFPDVNIIVNSSLWKHTLRGI